MFCGIPQTVEDAIEVMRSESDAAFVRVRFKDELLIAVRDEDGTVEAYRCRVVEDAVYRGEPSASPPDDRGSDTGEGR